METEHEHKLVTFVCQERGCYFDPTTDAAEATDHEQETGHRLSAVPGDPRDIAGRIRAEMHEERVARVLALLPEVPPEYVVYTAGKGEKLIETIEATAGVDLVRQFDRYVRTERGFVSVGFLRQLFAVTG